MLSIPTKLLLAPLQSTVSIVERRHTLPILSNIHWQLQKDRLVISATDLELEIEAVVTIPANSNLDREANDINLTIPARKLLDILRSLDVDSLIKFKQTSNIVNISSGKSKFSLQTLPSIDYPKLVSNNLSETHTISFQLTQKELKQMLLQVQYSMATQDIRYYLNGLLIKLEKNQIIMVATDGHRLGFIKKHIDQTPESTEFIIPRKAVLELVKLLSDDEDIVMVEKSETQASFKINSIILKTKLIEGTFPDYQRVIPVDYEKSFNINRLELLQALQRASILANEKFRGVRWVLSSNSLRVACNNADQEEAEEELEIVYQYDPIDIGFNINYLIDALNNIKHKEVECSLGDENSSMLVTEPENDQFKYVVMPMKI